MKYFIELTQSANGNVTAIKRYETENKDTAETTFFNLIKEARNGEGDGARILSGRWYDSADIVETWAKW